MWMRSAPERRLLAIARGCNDFCSFPASASVMERTETLGAATHVSSVAAAVLVARNIHCHHALSISL